MQKFSSDEEMIKYLSSKYHIIKKNKEVEKKLLQEVKDFQKESTKKLLLEDPFYENKKALEQAKVDLELNGGKNIENDLQNYIELEELSSLKIQKEFWHDEIKKFEKRRIEVKNKKRKQKQSSKDILEEISKDEKISRKLLQEQWQKQLDEAYLKWELNELQKYRETFLKKIQEWLELLQLLNDSLSGLGVFFDLSDRNLSSQDIKEIKKWADYIAKDKGVQELLNMLGRLRTTQRNLKKELVKVVKYVEEPIVDVNSKEEIVGITIGKDLEHALPQELALMSDEETSLLFDIKYVEGRIMSFDMEGISKSSKEIEEDMVVEVSEDEKKGPIIICVDTSGSMQGSPETIAKAITLFMATKAEEEDRACYLINFSTAIETMELTGNMGIQKIIKFLKKSFYGGTDATPALSHAVDMLQNEHYQKADILMISDFVMGAFSSKLKEKILNVKKNKNKFYSLAIGNIFLTKSIKDIFDNEWVYNPQNGSVQSIVKYMEEVF